MKKLLLFIVLAAAISVYGADYKVNCTHFAGSKMVDRMVISYEKNLADPSTWSSKVKIEATSPEYSEIPTGIYEASFADESLKNPDPIYDAIFFKPMSTQRFFDGATIHYNYDDGHGIFATIDHDSPYGAKLTQFLKCKVPSEDCDN